ncbi:MAG: polysaccharide biosynthesis C-terminal domain-containing protein, partial [Rhodothermales bacterium]
FPFAALNYLLSTAMTAANNEKTLAWVLGFAALLNVVLNLILIPEYSLYGAAAATITTEAVILIILTIRFLRDERPDSIAAETNRKR